MKTIQFLHNPEFFDQQENEIDEEEKESDLVRPISFFQRNEDPYTIISNDDDRCIPEEFIQDFSQVSQCVFNEYDESSDVNIS